ncbi:MAG TPA: D-alanine--D-alanine ligase family protein [Smithella sp.]|nr:D-alanine--D-alanine ligase [Smithella sp.]MDM7988450.1 D-alanine--D-alanine ligase family protein [Smithella sp.]HNY50395.1 D-alanine--D-alanine ligase family protein [Smithella sp.]HOG88992.1 D-alanine--D-alanine ligase family protein [Smithella sp.]HOU50932.1 D-alanine--D-alanine ligase family protein [Smithella sp.]
MKKSVSKKITKIRIGVLFGGRSGEHDVSLCSAASVFSALDRNKYDVTAIGIARDGRWHVQEKPEIVPDKDFGRKMALKKNGLWLVNHFEQKNKLRLYDIKNKNKEVVVDVIFPVIHGTFCEDGTLQGLLELAMVPYVGADVIGSAVGMDKDIAKRLLCETGIPVVPSATVSKQQWKEDAKNISKNVLQKLGLPLFIKPVCAGSSVGVKKVKKKEELAKAMNFALQFDNKVLVEKAIDCREIECAVLGNEKPAGSVLGEIIPHHEFYSYEAKYIDPNGAALKIPAELSKSLSDKIRKIAVEGYMALGCTSMARVDFFLDKKTNKFYLNEINTLPGFTSISMYPKLWEATGLSYGKLLDKLIELALDRHKKKLEIKTEGI